MTFSARYPVTLLLLAIALLIVACEGGGDAPTATPTSADTTGPSGTVPTTTPSPVATATPTPFPFTSPIDDPPPGFDLHLNEEFGFAFHYPESWSEGPLTETFGAKVMIEPTDGGAQFSVYSAIEVADIPDSERQSEYQRQFTDGVEIFVSADAELSDPETVDLDSGDTALRVKYTFERDSEPREFHILVVSDALRSYVITISGTAPEAEAAADAIDSILKSFVAFEPAPYGVARERSLTIPWDDPITLDPAMSRETQSHFIVEHLFSSLVTFSESLVVVPDLAERVELDATGTVYTFTLREGASFHDGRPITAEDVRYSLERAADPGLNSPTAAQYIGDVVGVKDKLAGNASSISGIEVVNDRTIKLTIDSPKAYFLAKLTYPTAAIVDKETVEPRGVEWWKTPINGSGPFKLNKWDEGEVLVLERFAGYHTPSTLEYAIFPIDLRGSSMQLYEADLTDVAFIGGSNIDRAQDPANDLIDQLNIYPQFLVNFVGFATQKPPFDDPKVRQAFVMAIDRQQMLDVVYSPHVDLANGMLPPGMPGYNEDLEPLPYDPAGARQLIAESKYAEDFPEVVYTTSGQGSVGGDIQFLIDAWRQNLGIEVTVRGLESNLYFYQLEQEVDNLFDYGWIADYPDPQNFLDLLLHSEAHDNNVGDYSNPEFDRLLEEARSETDHARRMALYQEAEQLMITDAAIMPIYHAADYVLVKPHVQGFTIGPLGIPPLQNVVIGPRED